MSGPVAAERKSFLPLRLRTTGTAAPHSPPPSPPMPSVSENNKNTSLAVGNRVLVNGLKNGILRYMGPVQFAQGLFCGVELDQPDGKHDGQVKETRYFQCPANHGVFVPRDKVMLAPSRARISSTQRPASRLKAPTMTRSITLSASINQFEQSKSVQLPDIVPSPMTTIHPVSLDQTIVDDDQQVRDEGESYTKKTDSHPQPTDVVETKIETQPVPIDEPCEPIEADFTDSVSLILHQLQQEQQALATRSSSVTISEDESDNDDVESVMESVFDEPNDTTHHSSLSSIFVPVELTKSSQTDISFHSHDQISFTQVQPTDEKRSVTGTSMTNKTTKSTVQPMKKNIEKQPVTPVTKRIAIPRKPTIIPPKKGSITKLQLNSAQSVTSLSSPSKVKLSASNSLASSQSDLATTNKNANSKITADKARKISQSIDLHSTSSDNKSNETLDQINALEQQLTTQKTVHRALQTSNEQLIKDNHHTRRQFDLMYILTDFFLNENDQIKQQHQHQIAQARSSNHELKTTIESLQNDLASLDRQHQLQIETLKKLHEQQLNEHRQQAVQFQHDKTELESRCSSLQEKVDGFLTEMANSAHADVLLCHVETLEKDRTSLHTVLELKSKEITQLRTKVHEQGVQLENKQAIEKRVEMTDNINQQLSYRLRQIQMTEKVAVIEREQFKEQVSQLERDNCQLKFENETLRYCLRQRASSVSTPSDNPVNFPPSSLPMAMPLRKRPIRHRAFSLTARILIRSENDRTSRSLSSLNCILYR